MMNQISISVWVDESDVKQAVQSLYECYELSGVSMSGLNVSIDGKPENINEYRRNLSQKLQHKYQR